MNKEINTDKIIREKLKGFSVPPPAHVWDNISGQLAAQKRKKRMMYMGWIAAAAVLVLAFVAGWYFNDSLKTPDIASTTEMIEQGKNAPETTLKTEAAVRSTEQLADNQPVQTEKSVKTEIIKINSSRKALARTALKNSESANMVRENFAYGYLKRLSAKITGSEIKNELAKNSFSEEKNLLAASDLRLIEENIKNKENNESPDGGLKMGMVVSPGLSSHIASHSANYDKQMTYNVDASNANVGGGFSFQVKTGKKWSIESGVYYAQNGQKSENSFNFLAINQDRDYMFAPSTSEKTQFSNTVKLDNGNLQMNSEAGVIVFSQTPKGVEISSDFDTKANAPNALVTAGEFSQVFDFVEVPLYVRYSILDSKLGLDVLGGVSAGLVVGNNAYLDNEFGLQNIGQTQDISTVNFSGTLGLGINYALSKHFSLAMEPRLNYYLHSINTNPDVDFRPYRIGFYTGIYYEF